MQKYITLILLLLTTVAHTLSSQNSVLTNRIDSLLLTDSNNPFNGIILINQDGKTIYQRKVGFKDLENKTPLEWNSEFVIGSISKQITAVLVLQQYEKGKIRLDVPIATYLPHLAQKWKDEVTVHQLLTHTHGITELDKSLEFEAGTQYAYSQIGYELLTQIVENVIKDSFVNLSENLFKRCDMKNSTHPMSANKLINCYYKNEDGVLVLETDKTRYVPAGGFISSANDLLSWNASLFGEKLLQDSTLVLMTTKMPNAVRNHPLFGMTNYGYGVTVNDENGLRQWGQTGFAPGFVSMNFYYPETKTNVIVLENIAYDYMNIKNSFYYHIHIYNFVRDWLIN